MLGGTERNRGTNSHHVRRVTGTKQECPAPVPVQSEPLHPELALTLSDLQESSRQLAQGFEQMSRELGRISRYMGDQDRRSREVQS